MPLCPRRPRRSPNSPILLAGLIALSGALHAQTKYFDPNGATTGLGVTGNTTLDRWNPASDTIDKFWSSSSSGGGTMTAWTEPAFNYFTAAFRGTAGNVLVPGSVSARGLQFLNDGWTLSGSGEIYLNSNSSSAPIINSVGGTQTLSVDLSSPGGINKTGAGTLVLSGANPGLSSYTTITAGTLRFGSDAARGSSYVVLSGGTLSATAALTLNEAWIAADSTIDATAPITINGDLRVDGNRTLTVENTTTLAGGLIQLSASSLTKAGAGTLIYTGTSSILNSINVTAGTFIVNGRTSSSQVTVGSGGTLGGSGRISGLATINSGGHLAPGNSPGTLTFTQGLTLTAGAILDFQLGTTSDLIRVSGGTLTGPDGGTVTLNLSDAGGFAPGIAYTLIDFAGAGVSSFDLSDFTFDGTLTGYTFALALVGSTLQLTATASAIPEPSTYAALLGVGAIGFAAWRRRSASARLKT